jgi:hypothetical protein
MSNKELALLSMLGSKDRSTEAAICLKPCKTLSNIKDDLTRPNKQSIVKKDASQAMQRLC